MRAGPSHFFRTNSLQLASSIHTHTPTIGTMMNVHLLSQQASRCLIRRTNLLLPPLSNLSSFLSTEASSPSLSYRAQKQAQKQRRRELYQAHEERLQRLPTRRVGRPQRGQKRRDFRSWFIPTKVHDEYHTRKARQLNLEFKIQVDVLLERIPVILPDKETWEVEMDNLQTYLGQFGKVYPKEFAEPIMPTAFTDEELMAMLPKGFVPAPRETEADASGYTQTTDRKLKTSIYLAVLENGKWQLPTVNLNDEETLLEAAQRAIPEKVGSSLEFWCPSNAPVAVQVVPFPEEDRGMYYGIKKFTMKLQYDIGAVEDKTVDDFAWLDRQEVVDRVQDQGDDTAKLYRYLL